MNRKKIVDRIAELFARFKAEVENLNAINLYDINIHAENVIIPVLNKVYGLNLVNANYEEKNANAIDLIDNENRVAFQVTSSGDSEKVKHTLEQFIKYKRNDEYDTLYLYLLKEKQSKYADKTFEKIIDGKFSFNSKNNIIDYSNILQEVNSWPSLPRIEEFQSILELEFSEEKIERRKDLVENKESYIQEYLYPNLIEIFPPKVIYIGKIGIDRDEIITKSWETEWKLKKNCSDNDIVKRSFELLKIPFTTDWIVFEKNIISFKNLSDRKEPLSKLIEPGTVEVFNLDDFYTVSYKYEKAILFLIDKTLQQLLFYKDIQWSNKDKSYKFKPPKALGERKVTWKNKKSATRTVVKEIWNTDRTQIIAFQQLSFKTQVIRSSEKWLLAISPSWRFTYDGRIPHKNESKMITDKKKLENNNAVYQHFMFIAFCLVNKLNQDEKKYDVLKFSSPFKLELIFKQTTYGY